MMTNTRILSTVVSIVLPFDLDLSADGETVIDRVLTADMLVALEEAFDINIPDEDAKLLKTFGQIIVYVEENIDVGCYPG